MTLADQRRGEGIALAPQVVGAALILGLMSEFGSDAGLFFIAGMVWGFIKLCWLGRMKL